MGVYDRQIASAKRMLAKFGELCTVNSIVDVPVSDPSQPWNDSPNLPVAHMGIRICFFPLNEKQRRTVQATDGDLTGYECAYIGQLPFTLGLKDFIVRSSGKIAKVISFDALDPNGEGVILYTVIVKL